MNIFNRVGRSLALAGSLAFTASGSGQEILVCGDSLMQTVSRSIARQFRATPSANVTPVVSIGTGLARPDVFDWPAKLREAAAGRPAAAVILLGANDGQNLRTASGAVLVNGTPEWEREYAARVASVLQTLKQGGVGYVLWVGLPDMRESRLQDDAQRINRIIRAECARMAGVEFFDIAPLFSPKPGTFSPYLVRPGGKVVQVRASDGIHFNADGADILAEAIYAKLNAKLRK